jgi:hypothetical protein
MTPLAHRILKQLTIPPKDRTFKDWPRGTVQAIRDAHYFETTQIIPLAQQLLISMADKSDGRGPAREVLGRQVTMASDRLMGKFSQMANRLAFLPAPITWIEFEDKEIGKRRAFLLNDGVLYQENWITVLCLDENGVDHSFSFPKNGDMSANVMHGDGGLITDEEMLVNSMFLGMCISMLALINTPKVIGRRQHLPHVGLQRALARAHGSVGKYPLQAWTEICLDVGMPDFAEGEHEARLSGSKALHFCRAHLRLRNGHVEFVRSHWRGDPAIGIKRSRYRLESKPA